MHTRRSLITIASATIWIGLTVALVAQGLKGVGNQVIAIALPSDPPPPQPPEPPVRWPPPNPAFPSQQSFPIDPWASVGTYRLEPKQVATPLAQSSSSPLIQGLKQGTAAFLAATETGAFIELTGVYPRQSINLLEGATFTNSPEGTTFVLPDGTVVPPLSLSGYEAAKTLLPPSQQTVLDDKFFWLLQTNPTLPLIAAGLETGDYRQYVHQGRFNTDAYYREIFFGQIFWAAQVANLHMAEVLPLVEIHLVTLQDAFFRNLDLMDAGTVLSFRKYEMALTNRQYLLRSLMGTPLEARARLKAIDLVEQVKADYVESPTTSTTITLGRLPLPTPTAAEDTVGVHALSIAHLHDAGIVLFPTAVTQTALAYRDRYRATQAQETALMQAITDLCDQHGSEILDAIDRFQNDRFWRQIGIGHQLDVRSVSQMDTGHLLGIYATRHEGLSKGLPAAESYPPARRSLLQFFQNNAYGLDDAHLLQIFLSDQALNPDLWAVLRKRSPDLAAEITAIATQLDPLEQAYQQNAIAEAQVFQRLQEYDLDISTEAFSLLTVALARRLSDLAYGQFQPSDRYDPNYLQFIRGVFPFMRDMPDMNIQWGDGHQIKRYGLENYLVPDLMALQADEAPVLTAIAHLRHRMVSQNDLNAWDFTTLVQLLSTSFNLSDDNDPSSLSAAQLDLLPLVAKYRSELKQIAGADGMVGTNVMHGMGQQDYRIPSWPQARHPGHPRSIAVTAASLHTILPSVAIGQIPSLLEILTADSGQLALSKRLVLQHNPEFTATGDGTLSLTFDGVASDRLTLTHVNRHFTALYSPLLMTRVALPPVAGPVEAGALNRLITQTQATYGGYTPPQLGLPEPLQTADFQP